MDNQKIIHAAGIMFMAGDKVLFLKRSPKGDASGTWCFPGGRVEPNETPQECAIRETREETGHLVEGELEEWTRRIGPVDPVPLAPDTPSTIVDFTTFYQKINNEFLPELDDEHEGFAWAPHSSPPEPLHPGARIALARITMDELGIAQAISAGELSSPQRYKNMSLFALRITGTGISFRRKLNEFVYRRPEHYLTDEFLQRCNGLPVIMMHPDTKVLDSKEFSDRIVGTMLLPYINGDEVWGVAKIFDDSAVAMMEKMQLSTSPGVVLRNADSHKMMLEDGSVLLIEGKPSLIDHLAICEHGVWDKGEGPTGVKTDIRSEVAMADEDRKEEKKEDAAKSDAAKADADAGQKLDKVLFHLDGFGKRMDELKSHCDRLDARMDAMDKRRDDDSKKRDDAAKSDEDKEKEEKEKADAKKRDDDARKRDDAKKDEDEKGKSEEVVADKKRRDAEEAEKKEREDAQRKRDDDARKARDDAARADGLGDLRKQVTDLAAKIPIDLSETDYQAMTDAQARADNIFLGFGGRAPRPLRGESLNAYRRRLATQLKAHSTKWKDVDVTAIADDGAFKVIEEQVYADAQHAANHPADIPGGVLREVKRQDTTGRTISTFYGPNTFIRAMTRNVRYAKRLGVPQERR